MITVRREDLARSIAEAVAAVPGVAGLHPGFGVEVATLFSGGKVIGLRLGGERVELYITAGSADLQTVAHDAARAAARVLAAVGDRRPVDVVVADVLTEALRSRAEGGAVLAAREGSDAGR